MVSVGMMYYIAFLVPAIFSFAGSCAVIATYFIFPTMRKGAVYKHIICLHIADIMQCGSWFLGPKFASTGQHHHVCLVQEYMFQYGSIAKGLWVCAISVLTYQSLMAMQLTEGRFRRKSIACFGLPFGIIAVSAYYDTGKLFCGGEFRQSLEHDRERAYLITYIGFIYASVIINIIVILLIYSKIRNLYATAAPSGGAEASNKEKLLSMCKVLGLYPIVCSVSWAPEVAFLFWKILALGIFTGISINSSGLWFALIFFCTNNSARRLWASKVSTVRSLMGISSRSDLTQASTAQGENTVTTELSSLRTSTTIGTDTLYCMDDNVMHFSGRNFSADDCKDNRRFGKAQKNPLR